MGFENVYYGEEVGAYIVLEEGARVSADAVIARCREDHDLRKIAQSCCLRRTRFR